LRLWVSHRRPVGTPGRAARSSSWSDGTGRGPSHAYGRGGGRGRCPLRQGWTVGLLGVRLLHRFPTEAVAARRSNDRRRGPAPIAHRCLIVTGRSAIAVPRLLTSQEVAAAWGSEKVLIEMDKEEARQRSIELHHGLGLPQLVARIPDHVAQSSSGYSVGSCGRSTTGLGRLQPRRR